MLLVNVIGGTVCDITSSKYGVCDQEDCTAGVRGAIEDCKGGGTIIVPKGNYTTAPFNLTSHQVLLVSEGATLLGTTNCSRIPVMAAFPSYGTSRDGHPARYVLLRTCGGLALCLLAKDFRTVVQYE